MTLVVRSKAVTYATQPPLIPANHIQVNPATFPHQTRSVAEVANWINDPGVRVIFEMSPLFRSVKRLNFLNTQLGNPELQDDPRIDAAVQRRDAYQRDVRTRIGNVIEWEWEATQAWELLEPIQRVEQGCVDIWEASAMQPDLIAQTWHMSHAKVLPETFDIKELMGFQWTVWMDGLRLLGRQAYMRRGLLRGPANLEKAQRTSDKREAIVARARSKWRNEQ